ncbi:MAG: hypothetical protein HPZ91_07290 [Lentisphaeria bacterium]|nr:hypothetical protein [Lentisphaeria bacterium]
MKKRIAILSAVAAVVAVIASGCAGTTEKLTAAAGPKNVGMDGYVMYGAVETANPETGTPQGRLIIGNVSYKSRRVSIPATEKVPTAGNYKHTKKVTLFGTSEQVTEWDFTAASPDEAAVIEKALREQAERDRANEEARSGDTAAEADAPASGE